jgi:hypothetical protein
MIALRCSALLAICLSILQPTAVRPQRPDESGGVAILIDRSASMASIDTGAAPAEQVATADALNLLPPEARSRKWLALRRRVEQLVPLLEKARRAAAELQYARLMDQSAQAQERRLNEAAEQLQNACRALSQQPPTQSLADLSNHINQPHWAEQARKKIDATLANLTEAQRASDEILYQKNPSVRAACAKLLTTPRLERARLAVADVVRQLPASVPIYGGFFDSKLTPAVLRANARPVWPADLKAFGDQSNISGAIHELFSQRGPRPLRAVLLFTDGRQVGGSLGPPLPTSAAPIFPVLCAGLTRDLAIAQIAAPTNAYLDEPASIRVWVRSTNLAGIPLKLQLHAGNLTQVQVFHLNQAGPAITQFAAPMLHPGEQSVQLTAEPVPGEASDQNNVLQCPIHVAPRRLNVALIGSFPTRDFQFLRADLVRTPWIDATAILPDNAISPEQLSRQQVIVLDDLAANQLNPAQWLAIHHAVEKDGAGLVLIAGANHLPAEYLNSPRLADLLPFDPAGQPIWRTWAGQDAFFRFTPVDPQTPVLDLEDNGMDESRQWSDLPAMYHYLQMPALKSGERPLLLERESGSPVLTESRSGAGRIYFVGFDETWRWRSVSPTIPKNFWSQLLRHAAPITDASQIYRPPAELADLSPESSLLERLANSTTGDLLTLADIGQVWQKIQQHQLSHPAVVEYPLWHSPWLFALVLGCLGAEWGLRKRFGLA